MDKTLKIEAAVILFLIIIICIIPSNGLKKAAKDVDKYQHVSNVTIINNGAEEDGVIESEEKEMIYNVFDLGDAKAKDVMVPRINVTFADIESSYEELIALFREDKFTRLPVYSESKDNVVGTINMKDLLLYDNNQKDFRIENILREAYFTYEYKNISELLVEMRKASFNIAIVLDEYGETAGLITLEDILEEIVGEINDEYDEEEKFYSKLNYNTFIFEGKTLLSDFCKILNVDDEEFEEVEGDADSLAGLLLEIKGDFPSMHEKIDYKNYTFEVMQIEERRISKIKVTVHPLKDIEGSASSK